MSMHDLSHAAIPEELAQNMALFLRLVRRVLCEYDEDLRTAFDELLDCMERVNTAGDAAEIDSHFGRAVALIGSLSDGQAQLLTRAFATYFHLANIAEEGYRVDTLRKREQEVLSTGAVAANGLVGAYRSLVEDCGEEKARRLLARLEFHPVFTAHPTEARRRAVEGKIRRIAALLAEHDGRGGVDALDNERKMLQEIDALFRTNPIALKRPSPVEEAESLIAIFDNTLLSMVIDVYRRFDDALLGAEAGRVKPVVPAFFRAGSWIGSDRDGNPNVTAKVSRKVAEKFREHALSMLAERTEQVGRSLTLESGSTPPSDALVNLWNHQVEMSEILSTQALEISAREPHRAVMLVIANRLQATIARTADLMYAHSEDLLDDLHVVQCSLVDAGAPRAAYGPLQDLIWLAETFGFHLAEMEFRQHSLVHARALDDIRAHGARGERGELEPMTREVLDTFRAIGSIQRKGGLRAARRYIVSFTKSADDIAAVYELCRLAFAHEKDVPALDAVPLFEQVSDLEHAVEILDEVIELPQVKQRLAETGNTLEVMLGYSDSSKDAGPVSATLVLHTAQLAIADWAKERGIRLILMHGRGGAVGRGGGPANHAVLAQPKGSVNGCFKLTEQGEVIFARYGNAMLARRHVESVAAATLLHSSPRVEHRNMSSMQGFSEMAAQLDAVSRTTYLDLLETPGFVEWFATVTPLNEVGLLPIGSRPAKRGLAASTLEDLRTIPWVFSWSQARVNLAAWYGLGSACQHLGELGLLRKAYAEWPFFTTFIDNIEMSLAKTDDRIARMYLALGDRGDLADKVLREMELTVRWVMQIIGEEQLLQRRRVLGPVVKNRLPFVNALSLMQANALRTLRTQGEILAPEQCERETSLILCTVSGVAAGLQNTG